MASSELQEALSEEEIQAINPEVASKLENHLQSKRRCNVNLQGEIEKIKADYEQKCYELDKKLIESASRLDSESLQHGNISAKCAELETELKAVQSKNESLESSLHELQQEHVGLKRIKDTWSEEKLNLQHIIDKRDLEIARLNDEWKTVSQRLSETTLTKNELQLKLDEQSSLEVTAHYHGRRVEQEKDLLLQQNASLSEQFAEKSSQLTNYKKETENQLISLRGQLELTTNENKFFKETNESLKQSIASLSEKLNQLQEKINKNADEHHSMEEMHRSELRSQTRLAELYKASAEEAEKKSDELISAVEELQTFVRSGAEKTDAVQVKLDETLNESSEKSLEIERLKKELENANDLVVAHKKRELNDEELSKLCPTAAMTSSFIKSGMTLTQIYSLYVEQSDELIVAKEENKRLNEAMDSILEELNAKAPLLKRQREDYERALMTITQLTSQTDEAALQFQQVRQEADDALRHTAHLNREKEKWMKENGDLSKQVCFLLKEVEEMRGRQVAMSPRTRAEKSLLVVNDDGSCNDVSSSSELITSTLVTFKDIAELQEQNQKLLAVIRKLSGEQEEAEQEGIDEKTLALQKELDSVNDELDRLREDRSRQMTMVEAIVRQRDMYRVLLAQNPQGGVPLSVLANPSTLDETAANTSIFSVRSASTTPTKRASSLSKSPQSAGITSNESAKKALLELQEEFNEYKKDVQDNTKILTDKVEDLKSQLSQHRTTCAKLEAQVEFSKERCEMMKQSGDSMKKEADALRSRNTQLHMIAQRHERTVTDLDADLRSSQELSSKLQARIETAKSELEISKRAEDRLTTENASLLREQRNQTLLLNNLQKVQQSMERQTFEVRTQLHSRIEAQDREIASLRQTSQATAQSKQESVQAVEKQLYAVQQMYDAEKSKCQTVAKELDDAKIQMNCLEIEKKKAEAKLTAVEERLNRLGGRSSGTEGMSDSAQQDAVMHLNRELKEKQDEISSLEARIDKARSHVEHYKEVAAAAEESLKQSNVASKELMESLQIRLDESSKQQTNIEQQLVKLEAENQALKNEKYKVTGEVERQTAELRKQLASVQSELDSALRRTQDAIKHEQIAREDLKLQVSKAEESNDNYQREMILHASAVQQLLDLKEKVKNNDEEVDNLKQEKRCLAETLEEKGDGWRRVEEKLKAENDSQKARILEIEKQNDLLHEQIQKLSTQLVDLQSKQSSSTEASPFKLFKSRDPVAMAVTAASGDQTDKSSEQLLDVIKFLRREKEISDTKCELVQSENIRSKQQLLQLHKQLKEIQDSLSSEQAKVQEQVEKLTKLSSLERVVANMQIVKSNNESLREERERLTNELRATNARLTRLQEEFAPLQTKNREMSAQCVALQHDKKALGEEVDRWKERVQQMTQSPRRQDPEEYRRLLLEKSTLAKNVDTLNKENAELKSESSALKGQIRTLDSNLQSANLNVTNLTQNVSGKDEEIKKMKAEMEEKVQTLNKIRRVGRRFKVQYEDLLAKTQKEAASKAGEGEQAATEAGAEARTEQNSEALKQAESNVAKALEDKARLQAELSAAVNENKTLKEEKAAVEKQLQERNSSQSELMGENQALRAQFQEKVRVAEEHKKKVDEMTEKGQRFGKVLSSAKTQIEKLRKDNEEAQKEREKLLEEVKTAVEMRDDMQNKVEDLQRQLLEGRAAPPTQEASGVRKANIRPTSRVHQVTPLRITRTARVMPEPQQDSQDTDRPGPSSVAQIASSSTQAPVAATVSPIVPSASHTTVFVQPMSPARQQQHVVSSGTQSPSQPVQVTSQAAQEQAVQSSEASPSAAANDSDQAIVSSSDDQSMHDEPTPTSIAQPSSTVTASSRSVLVTEPSSSSSATRFAVGASSSTQTTVPVQPSSRTFHQAQKRSHEQTDDVTPSRSVPVAIGSRETQIALAPAPKRQRGSPDQSSDSVAAVTPSTDVRTEIQPPASSEIASSQARVPDQSQQSDDGRRDEADMEMAQADQGDESSLMGADSGVGTVEVNTSSQVATSSHCEEQSSTQDQVASSSMVDREDVIVLSSDSDIDQDDVIGGQDDNSLHGAGDDDGDDVDDDMPDDAIKHERAVASTTHPGEAGTSRPLQQASSLSANHPFIVIQQPRMPNRPPPLTPGIVPTSMSDPDGDSIVPCTPTLVANRPDDSCQAINSPRVPPGQAIRFQFDDVPTDENLAAVPGGLDSVDNTLMDLAGAGEDNARNVPTTPVPSSSSTVFSTSLVEMNDPPQSTSGIPAVSSTIGPQADEEQESEDIDHDPTLREATSIPTTIRGRRFRIKGAPRSRGRGANSPSTSNQP